MSHHINLWTHFCYRSWVEPHNLHSLEDVPLMIYSAGMYISSNNTWYIVESPSMDCHGADWVTEWVSLGTVIYFWEYHSENGQKRVAYVIFLAFFNCSVLDFWKIELKKSSSTGFLVYIFRTGLWLFHIRWQNFKLYSETYRNRWNGTPKISEWAFLFLITVLRCCSSLLTRASLSVCLLRAEV